jgi:hypothetical protein
VGKLLTIGGVGIWWIVDIILLVSVSSNFIFVCVTDAATK